MILFEMLRTYNDPAFAKSLEDVPTHCFLFGPALKIWIRSGLILFTKNGFSLLFLLL